MRTAILLAVSLMATLLAGCSGGGGQDTDDTMDVPGSGVPADVGLLPPTWQVGDWWDIRFNGGGGARFIVTEDNGDSWTLDVDDQETAFWNILDPTPFQGAIRKADLAGDEDGSVVVLLDWPLIDGKKWTMEWDGATWDVEAERLGEDRFRMTATTGDLDEVRVYTYDNRTRWIDSTQAMDGNGTLLWGAEVTGSGSGHSGEYVRWAVESIHHYVVAVGQGSTSVITVPEGLTDIYLRITTFCNPEGPEGDQGPYYFAFFSQADPQNRFDEEVLCPDALDEEVLLDPVPGDYTVSYQSLGAQMDILIVPRALETFTL